MSKEQGKYITENQNERKIEMQFVAKRLTDFTKDFEKLEEGEKKYIIERVDKFFGIGLVELYNALVENMESNYVESIIF